MKEQVFLPTKIAQDAKYVLNSKDNVFSAYLMKNFRAELSSPSGDYIISTEKGTTILNEELNYLKLYIVGVVSYEKFAVMFVTNNAGRDFIMTTEDFVTIKSMIIGCFGFTTNRLIRTTIADCSSHYKCFFADGVHPLRCVLIEKGTYIFKQSYYITLINNGYNSFYVKVFYRTISVTALSSIFSGNINLSKLTQQICFYRLMTSHDALDALSVSYCFERGIGADKTSSNAGYYKCGTINFAIYDGRVNLPQCNFVEDTQPYYLTSLVNKPNELASTSFIVNVDYHYLFARDFLFITSKEISSLGAPPVYKETDKIFYIPLIVQPEKYVNDNYCYVYYKKGSSDAYISKKMAAEYQTSNTISKTVVVIYSSNNQTYIDTFSDNDSYVRIKSNSSIAVLAMYIDYNVDNYHWRVDVLIKKQYSIQLTGAEALIEESKIYDRQRRAIIPDDVCMHAEKLFCNVSKNEVDDYTVLNALIYANKDAISIENITKSISMYSSDQDNAKDATVFLPDTRYILGYQAKDIYGCWSPILLGESAEKLEEIPVTFKITIYDWFYYYFNSKLYVWDGVPISIVTSGNWNLYNDGTTSIVSSADATFNELHTVFTSSSGTILFNVTRFYNTSISIVSTSALINDDVIGVEYAYSTDGARNKTGLVITLKK